MALDGGIIHSQVSAQNVVLHAQHVNSVNLVCTKFLVLKCASNECTVLSCMHNIFICTRIERTVLFSKMQLREHIHPTFKNFQNYLTHTYVLKTLKYL